MTRGQPYQNIAAELERYAGYNSGQVAAIGGVPARVLADRMACLEGEVVADVVVPTAD